MKALFVCNPVSGGSDEADRDELTAALSDLGSVVVWECADRESFTEDLREQARDAAYVLVAAGDGTLNLTLTALQDRLGDIVLGVIPMGTGNDFARTVGLPEDPIEAARVLASGEPRAIDTGLMVMPDRARPFINACMGGFPVAVDEAITEEVKARLGPLAFWWGGAKAAADLDRFEVTVDGEVHRDVIAVGIGNGRTAGGGIEVFPQADPADGLLDVCVMMAGSMLKAAKLAAKVRSGDHTDEGFVAYSRGRSVDISSAPPLEFNVDGEVDGFTTPATFEAGPKVRFLFPAR